MESSTKNKAETKVAEQKKPLDELELAVGNLSGSVVLSRGGQEEQDGGVGLQSASGANAQDTVPPTGRFSQHPAKPNSEDLNPIKNTLSAGGEQ